MAIHLCQHFVHQSRYMEAVDTELYSTWANNLMEHTNTKDLWFSKLGFIIVLCNLCLFQAFLSLPFCSTYSALLLFLLHCHIHIWCVILSCLCHFVLYFLLLLCFNLFLAFVFSSPFLTFTIFVFYIPRIRLFFFSFCGLLFCTEDGSIRSLLNICKTTVSHPRRLHCSLI
jgi:hypothetical protein